MLAALIKGALSALLGFLNNVIQDFRREKALKKSGADELLAAQDKVKDDIVDKARKIEGTPSRGLDSNIDRL